MPTPKIIGSMRSNSRAVAYGLVSFHAVFVLPQACEARMRPIRGIHSIRQRESVLIMSSRCTGLKTIQTPSATDRTCLYDLSRHNARRHAFGVPTS